MQNAKSYEEVKKEWESLSKAKIEKKRNNHPKLSNFLPPEQVVMRQEMMRLVNELKGVREEYMGLING